MITKQAALPIALLAGAAMLATAALGYGLWQSHRHQSIDDRAAASYQRARAGYCEERQRLQALGIDMARLSCD
jgi:hypothetical protein